MAESITVHPAAAALGAYVDGFDLVRLLQDDAQVTRLKALLVEHQVLFLPDQQVEPVVFEELAQCFGRPVTHAAYPILAAAPFVQVLQSTPEEPSKLEQWHADMTFMTKPPPITLLHAQVVPAVGGDTLWASAVAAFAALSGPMQQLLRELRAVHDIRHGFRESLAEPGGEERLASAIAENPPVSHPLVRTHEDSGREAIYVNPLFTTHIEGLSALESDALLEFLFRHLKLDEFTVRMR